MPTAPTCDFNHPACVEALQYWIDLTTKYHAHPPGIADWGTTPRDFLEGKAAIIWHTTGNLSNIKANAKFPFGVAMLPAHKRRGSPTGGGNFHLFKSASPDQQQAVVALPALGHLAGARGAVGHRHRLRGDPRRCLADRRHEGLRGIFPGRGGCARPAQGRRAGAFDPRQPTVTQALDDEVQAALLGRKQPKVALADAEATATRLLRPYTR